MKVIQYDSKYKNNFIDFNKTWIQDYFGSLEEEDYEVFENIEEKIKHGAMIFFAIENNIALATCMVKPIDNNNTWEICKLASNKYKNHKGCGSAVFKAAMNYAIEHEAKRIFLVTNSILKPAIHIYEKYGFTEYIPKDCGYSRVDIAYEKYIR